MTDLRFPEGFTWGAGTAAYQVEGAAAADGRGLSVWDTYLAAGRGFHADTGAVAADHYHRLDADLDLIARLGLTAYRFSIAWPRVMPDGVTVNQKGLDFYRRLVQGLRDRGITPAPTLYHFDLPQALEDQGGWTDRATAHRFADYTEVVADALGDSVDMWMTVNEPATNAWLGYGHHSLAPGRDDTDDAIAACHHQLLGHGLATQAIRAAGHGRPRVGPALGLAPVRAVADAEEDLRAAELADVHFNRFLLDPLLRGHYPPRLLDHYAGRARGFHVVREGDLDTVAAPLDFLGVNYYRPRCVVAAATARTALREGRLVGGATVPPAAQWMPYEEEMGFVEVRPLPGDATATGWRIAPDALTDLLLRLTRDYGPLPLYVTENGAAFHDYVTPEGEARDPERVSFLDAHLRAAHEALARGADLRGYFVWSLMDNLEWSDGYSSRFGLTYIDFGTQRRVPKHSFHWYRGVIAANGLSHA